ncbi:MAG TPA: hypothetical protein VKH42_16870, partial [Vicinamibacterales bacterium]|nr:hypothetical protein [Vicinamibacterales bacterium]
MRPRDEYERRLEDRRAGVAAIDRTHVNLSNARLATAAVLVLLLWFALGPATISPLWPIAVAIAFGALVIVHARVIERGERARRAVRIYQRGLDRLDFRWAGSGRPGDAFLDGHEYARDLDLFGRGSLFELMNVAQTEAGESTLAGWLRGGAPPSQIRARH